MRGVTHACAIRIYQVPISKENRFFQKHISENNNTINKSMYKHISSCKKQHNCLKANTSLQKEGRHPRLPQQTLPSTKLETNIDVVQDKHFSVSNKNINVANSIRSCNKHKRCQPTLI